MTKSPQILIIKNIHAFILAAIFFFVSTLAINLFLLYVVIPSNDNFISLYIPAKTGGETFFLDVNEAMNLVIWTTIVAFFLSTLVLLFAKLRQGNFVAISTLLIFIGAILYFPVILGNSFDALFDGAWSLLGVAIALVIAFSIQVTLLKQIAFTKKP